MIDATKLKRAGFIGAATGYYLAQLGGEAQRNPWAHLGEAIDLLKEIWAGQLRRMTRMLGQSLAIKGERGAAGAYLKYETAVMLSVNEFEEGWTNPEEALRSVLLHERIAEIWKEQPEKAGPVFARNAEPKGPMSVFGYDYFEDKLGREAARKVRLLDHRGLWGASGDVYAYEVLNYVDGQRTAQEIRDAVSAEFGPVPLEVVVEYLRALEKIGVVRAIQ